MFQEQHSRYRKYKSPLVDERTQWQSTRECLRVLTNDYLREIRTYITKSRRLMFENRDDPDLVNFFSKQVESFERHEADFLALAPAIRMKRLNIKPFTKIGKCPICFGEGTEEDGKTWCSACDGWGYAVKSIFEYLDSPEPAGIVVYFVRNEVVVDYITIGTKVTVEI